MYSTTDENLIHGEKSLGVRRIEAINKTFTKWTRVTLFVGIFLVAYAYGLDGTSKRYGTHLWPCADA